MSVERPANPVVTPESSDKKKSETKPALERDAKIDQVMSEANTTGDQVYPFLDKDGNPVCELRIRYQSDEQPRLVDDITLVSSKTGEHISILPFFNIPIEGQDKVQVFVREGNKKGGVSQYMDAEKRVYVNEIDSPGRLAILMHELGHAEQAREERFEKIKPLYEPVMQGKMLYGLTPPSTKMMELIMEAVPDARAYLEQSEFQEYLRLVENEDAVDKRMDVALHQMDETRKEKEQSRNDLFSFKFFIALPRWISSRMKEKTLTKDWDHLRAERRTAAKELRDYQGKSPIDLLMLPIRIMERDATRRAFQVMRTLRNNHGIDLSTMVKMTTDGEGVVKTAKERLKEGYECALYEATHERMRIKTTDNEIGVMPRARIPAKDESK